MHLKQLPIETVNGWSRNTLMQTLGIECIELGADYLVARMPVDSRPGCCMAVPAWH
jgi:1,4-dihydroxy-2-naphthoyl-CoA hydrolase